MEFRDLYEQPRPPQLEGQAPIPISNFRVDTLRRSQCLNLARAFEVEVPVNATKAELIPVLIAAERQGKFKGRPHDYKAFAKALQDPDAEPHPRPWELVGLSEDAWTNISEQPKNAQITVAKASGRVYQPWTRQWMMMKLKELNQPCPFGATNPELEKILNDAGVFRPEEKEQDDG